MQAEIERLRADNARLQSEMIRLVGRNLALSPTTALLPLPRNRASIMCAPCSAASWMSQA